MVCSGIRPGPNSASLDDIRSFRFGWVTSCSLTAVPGFSFEIRCSGVLALISCGFLYYRSHSGGSSNSLNQIVQNWHYIFPSEISTLHFAIESSIDFSTVVPAVLSTTYLFFLELNKARLQPCKKTPLLDARVMWGLFVVGILSLILLWLAPSGSFALVWIAPFLVIEPVLYFRRYPTLIKQFSEGQWILIASAMSASLFTGFWWECWNFYSLPKWVYTVPYLGFWKVFEMPVLGYLGYPLFGLIVFSYTVLALFLFFGDRAKLTKSVVRAFGLAHETRRECV